MRKENPTKIIVKFYIYMREMDKDNFYSFSLESIKKITLRLYYFCLYIFFYNKYMVIIKKELMRKRLDNLFRISDNLITCQNLFGSLCKASFFIGKMSTVPPAN